MCKSTGGITLPPSYIICINILCIFLIQTLIYNSCRIDRNMNELIILNCSGTWVGLSHINEMQTPPPPQKETFFIFLSKLLRHVLKRMKNNFCDFCDFHFWVTVEFVHNFQVFLTDQKCKKNVSRDAQCSKTDFDF